MHHAAGERAVGAGPDQQRHVGLPHRVIHVDIDRNDLRAPLLPSAGRMGHHVDLRRDGVGAPDDHAIRFRHLARIGTGELAGAGHVAAPGRVDADRRIEARVFLDVAQPVDPVALHAAHRAGVEIGPDAFGAELPLRLEEGLRRQVERLVPGDPLELAGALGTDALQRMQQPLRMVDALGIARDLRADDAGGVAVRLRPRTRPIVAPSITSTSSAQAEGQSCGQTEGRVSTRTGAFMVRG